MKTMLWKELRENLKWAMLAMLALLLAEIYALSIGRSESSDRYYNLTLCSNAFLLVTSFGYALAGAALGLLQILPELSRDRWAALLHRPVEKGVIFWGKAGAGVILYLLATVPPLLVAMAYVAVPGQFSAPFLPAMALPAASDLLMGLAFYFGAMLLGLHRGRWWGSRGILALSLVPVFVLHSSSIGFWKLPLAAVAVLFLASWGAFRSGGRLRKDGGLTALGGLIALWGGAFTLQVLAVYGLVKLTSPKADSYLQGATFFQISRDGEVFLGKYAGRLELTDLDGKAVTDEKYLGNESRNNLLTPLPLIYSLRWALDWGEKYPDHGRMLFSYLMPVFTNHDSKENWYLLIRENYFIGFDKLSRRMVGICDAEGFKAAGAEAKPFDLRMVVCSFSRDDTKLFRAGPRLYKIDFSGRSLVEFFHAGNEVICGADFLFDSELSGVAVALENEVRTFDGEGKPLRVLPYSRRLQGSDSVYYTENESLGRMYVQIGKGIFSAAEDPSAKSYPIVLDEWDNKGKMLRSVVREVEGVGPKQNPWEESLRIFVPPLPAAILAAWDRWMQGEKKSLTFDMPSELNFSLRAGSEPWAMAALGLGLGVAALILGCRGGLRAGALLGWTLLVICFGLPGLLVFCMAAGWPERVCCPECGEKRPIDEEECPACKKGWRGPLRDGTEIFEGRRKAEA